MGTHGTFKQAKTEVLKNEKNGDGTLTHRQAQYRTNCGTCPRLPRLQSSYDISRRIEGCVYSVACGEGTAVLPKIGFYSV